MKNSKTIKLKPDFVGFSRKIKAPEDFESLMTYIEMNFQNKDPNKIFRITDLKTNKIIKDKDDFDCLILENYTENEIKLLISLIDKPIIPEYQEERNNICFKSNLILPKQVELTEEEQIKQKIREMVQTKLKILEKSIIDDISKEINPIIIHKGINCSICGKKDIVGIRYKCTICPNFNLCENCEENTEHDDNHVLLKIKEPILSEKNLEEKIQSTIIIPEIDFEVEPTEFNFKASNLINIQTVTLTNTTNFIWKKKTKFICIKKNSNLIGNDIILEEEIKPGNYTNIEIVYENMEKVKQNNEYYSFFKLIDENNKQIGKIHTFKIHIT